ncbi:MAG: hypothetical protein JKY31_12165 [Rhodobacteraceae bacterium]|nr:hypothetical protein [Paracoccaceae bacterium]
MDIMAGLSAISETLKITKELRAIDKNIDTAEWKLRLSELIDKLLEAKESLIDAKTTEADLKEQISNLVAKAIETAHLEDDRGRLYEIDELGKRIGEPFCNLCYVKEDKKFRMIYHPLSEYTEPHYWCENCKTTKDD